VQELNKDTETVRKILTADLGMREVLAKLVSQIVSKDQKQWQYDVCVNLSLVSWPKEITFSIKFSLLITQGRFNIIQK
jgi:outer membrane lipoprotein-sorting protein